MHRGLGHHLLLDVVVQIIRNIPPILQGVVDVGIEGLWQVGQPELVLRLAVHALTYLYCWSCSRYPMGEKGAAREGAARQERACTVHRGSG